MIYQNSDGTYVFSSFDGEWSRTASKEEGIAALRVCGCPEEIINTPRPHGGFVMC